MKGFAPIVTTVCLVSLFLLSPSCRRGSRQDPQFTQVPAIEPQDRDDLLIIHRIPLGSSYDQVRQALPKVSSLLPELAAGNLSEARAQLPLLGHNVTLEFNFRAGLLYSFYYFIYDLKANGAIDLYQRLQAFYTEENGEPQEETAFDPGGRGSVTSFWQSGDYSTVLTRSAYNESYTLSWGFQGVNPGGGRAP